MILILTYQCIYETLILLVHAQAYSGPPTLHRLYAWAPLRVNGGNMKRLALNTKNLIQVIGTIDEAAYADFSLKLREFEKAKAKDVFVELASGGGTAYDALAFYSRMRMSPCTITILCTGFVASAAVLVLAAGDRRLMTKEAWVMVHEDQANKLTARVSELEKYSRQLRRLEDQWNKLLADSSRLSAAGWSVLHKTETHLSPEDCKRHGLIEEIV